MEKTYKRLGFWFGTLIYFFSILFVIKGAAYGLNYPPYVPNNAAAYKAELFTTNFSTLSYFIIPHLLKFTTAYIVYLLFIFVIVPGLGKRKYLIIYGIGILSLYIITSIVIGFTDTLFRIYLYYYKGAEPSAVQFQVYKEAFVYTGWIFGMYVTAAIIKANCSKVSSRFKNIQSASFIINDSLTGIFFCILVFSVIYIPDLTADAAVLWGYIAFTIPLYAYFSLVTIPMAKENPQKLAVFWWHFFKVIFLLTVFIGIYTILNGMFSHHTELIVEFIGFNFLFHVLVTTPATWYIYHYRFSKWRELKRLKSALRQSSASIDFLRSQINPHFLFNTLNALYGAAIRENSVNTAAGIQKLSEMMRFMLHENHQPSIPLKKEIDYTRNYIELQLLRVGTSPKLVVESEITGDSAALSIAPMILIPFIENAFKHGISRRHQSWIKVKLSLKEKRLHFTVVNSIHERSFRAPEERSGVGLENVMQRLSLSYHQKHELSIDAKPNEFIVDLTIDLSV